MQSIFSVIYGQLILRAVEREFSMPNSVPVTPDERTEIRIFLFVFTKRGKTKCDIVVFASVIRDINCSNNTAVGNKCDGGAFVIVQRVLFYRYAVPGCTKGLVRN